MSRVLITGSSGFIGGYLVQELLNKGHTVVGVDNQSKYGQVTRSYDNHPNYTLINGDATDTDLLTEHLMECDYFISAAALRGGVAFSNAYVYDLLATNERIIAAACDAAIKAHLDGRLQRITVVSSSLVYESAEVFPLVEGMQLQVPPPMSSLGFQNLGVEYFVRAAHRQYGLPYTIARPFSCVGIGEGRALAQGEILSGNIQLATSHVVPDMVQKVLKGQNPLRILGDGSQIRHFSYGGDLAKGIVLAMDHPQALNEDFNLSTSTGTTILALAELIWKKINGQNEPFRYECDAPFEHDVKKRIPSTKKAKDLLDFEANTDLDSMLDEVIPWIEDAIATGVI